MSRILSKEEFDKYLNDYYISHYGKRDTDVWYDKPAVNVVVFGRDNKIISLKSHIFTGEVEEKVEEI